jgi:hypothetical protein
MFQGISGDEERVLTNLMIKIDGQDEIASPDFGKFGEQIATDGQRMDGLRI